jgi:hypothetical protein
MMMMMMYRCNTHNQQDEDEESSEDETQKALDDAPQTKVANAPKRQTKAMKRAAKLMAAKQRADAAEALEDPAERAKAKLARRKQIQDADMLVSNDLFADFVKPQADTNAPKPSLASLGPRAAVEEHDGFGDSGDEDNGNDAENKQGGGNGGNGGGGPSWEDITLKNEADHEAFAQKVSEIVLQQSADNTTTMAFIAALLAELCEPLTQPEIVKIKTKLNGIYNAKTASKYGKKKKNKKKPAVKSFRSSTSGLDKYGAYDDDDFM